jgi:hypothetical protein
MVSARYAENQERFACAERKIFNASLGCPPMSIDFRMGSIFVIQAARVVARHPDEEHLQFLIQSASMVAGSPVLPVRNGHGYFELSAEEQAAQSADDFDLETAEIPRPGSLV